MMLKLEQALTDNLNTFGVNLGDVGLMVNPDLRFGYFSTPIAFKLAKTLSGSAMHYAELFVDTLRLRSLSWIDKIEILTPGYINFYTKPGFEYEALKELISLKSFHPKSMVVDGLQTALEWRRHYTKQCLVNILDYFDRKYDIEVMVRELHLGSVSSAFNLKNLSADLYRFSALICAPEQDWVVLKEDVLANIFYACRRTHQVLSYLNSLSWSVQRYDLSGFKQETAQSVFVTLLSFEHQLQRVTKYLNPQILAIFLKNLASRMHCLYNEVTLWSGDVSDDLMNRCLLQACHKILMLSFALLGVKGP